VTQLYVYKCRDDPETEYAAYGNWEDVLTSDEDTEWGGSWATNNPSSKRLFEEKIQPGDLVLAWQTDKCGAVGVCEVVALRDSARGQDVVLRRLERFPSPVRLHELKKTTFPELKDIAALNQGNIATLYETSRNEAFQLLTACNSSYASQFAPRARP
jgi:hypothetical protein